MYNQYFIFTLFLLLFFFTFIIFHFSNVLSTDDEFFSIVPEDYYDPRDYGEESQVHNQLQENNTYQNTLPTTTTNKYSFNIVVTADWGCEKDTKKTAENIQKKNPELVIFVFIDPYIDYNSSSTQYQFIEQDLKTASTNPKIDWTFVV